MIAQDAETAFRRKGRVLTNHGSPLGTSSAEVAAKTQEVQVRMGRKTEKKKRKSIFNE